MWVTLYKSALYGRPRLDGVDVSRWSPAQILIATFALLIVGGGLLLSLPVASKAEPLGFFQALFTATSAVCVTGLLVVDTVAQFTFFGQAVILVLIQLGGLGLMTMTTMMAILLGRRISFRSRLIVQEALNQFSLEGLVRLVKAVGAVTLLFEGVGALLLSLRFVPAYGWGQGLWYGVFHSISAFCNAGFDLFGGFRSLSPYTTDWLVNLVLIVLIVSGGIGFSVIAELWQKRHRKTRQTLSLHTRLVLLMTLLLTFIGTIFILLVEWDKALIKLPLPSKILAAFFQAVSARTAGFSTLSLKGMHEASLLALLILMFIGSSPASTGGGVKTTTFAVLLALVISGMRGHDEVRIFHRRIPNDIVKRAVAIIVLSFTLVISLTMLICLVDGLPLQAALLEATSAFTTVGWSMGVTPTLSPIVKVALCFTMFAGRVGPMSLAFALAHDRVNARISYPEERIIVG
ncbi:MAG: Trk family potassium uptake protein [Firmicutes bacterium]|nr:Trk family potassium uptake protein [Bacillota bacterium]